MGSHCHKPYPKPFDEPYQHLYAAAMAPTNRQKIIAEWKLPDFFDSLHANAERTQLNYGHAITALAEKMAKAGLAPDEVTAEHLNHYYRHLEAEWSLMDSTINGRKKAARRYFAWALRRKMIHHNPMAGIENARLMRTMTRRPAPEDVARMRRTLVNCAQDTHGDRPSALRNLAVFDVLIRCGPRVGELCALQVTDIDRLDGENVLYIAGTKTYTQRRVPLPDDAHRTVTDWLTNGRPHYVGNTDPHPQLFLNRFGRPMSRTSVNRMLHYYSPPGRRVNPHGLRAHCATELDKAELDRPSISAIMGHARGETTSRYVHRDDDDTRRRIREANRRVDARYRPTARQ